MTDKKPGPACRLCGNSAMNDVLDLGSLPIAHRLLKSADASEEVFPMRLQYCGSCGFFQIPEPVDPEILYRDYNYCFTDWKPQPHIVEEADLVAAIARRDADGGAVAEVGANDGMFLSMLRDRGVGRVNGIEPNHVARAEAQKKGLTVSGEMLTPELARELRQKHGEFSVFVARQVLEHLLDIEGFFRSADELLGPRGHVFVDIPDFMCGLATGDCSMLWEEHPNYFTEPTLLATFRRFGYEPVETRRYNFSGGTVAVLARRTGVREALPAPEGFDGMARTLNGRVRQYEARLKQVLEAARAQGMRIALYGTGCRACTQVNGLGIGGLIDFAVDDQVEKQGLFMPGSALPIHPSEVLRSAAGKTLVLLAVNQENEEKVTRKIKDTLDPDAFVMSIQCPNDIMAVLELMARKLDV